MLEIHLIKNFYLTKDQYQYVLFQRDVKGNQYNKKFSKNISHFLSDIADYILTDTATEEDIKEFRELEKEINHITEVLKNKKAELMELIV